MFVGEELIAHVTIFNFPATWAAIFILDCWSVLCPDNWRIVLFPVLGIFNMFTQSQILMHAMGISNNQKHCKTRRLCIESWFWEKSREWNPLPHWEVKPASAVHRTWCWINSATSLPQFGTVFAEIASYSVTGIGSWDAEILYLCSSGDHAVYSQYTYSYMQFIVNINTFLLLVSGTLVYFPGWTAMSQLLSL